jgi:hypothetical protein
MFKDVDAIIFSKRFPNNEACLRFLADKKWKTDTSVLAAAARSI